MLSCIAMLATHHTATGEPFAQALERYLEETLHDRIRVKEFRDADGLPVFLERTYSFHESAIARRRCVFLAASGDVPTPANIARHVALVRSAVDATVVFAAPAVSAYNRSRLIAHGVAFVVPGNQLYIPELAMDLREHFRAPRAQPVDGLSPAAHAVLVHHLLRLDETAAPPTALAKQLHYSSMSIGRAFDELAAVSLAKPEQHGKERHLQFDLDRRALLEASRPLLRSPVRTVKYVRGGRAAPPLKLAGESALSELTDLSGPERETWAVAARDWKTRAERSALIEVEEQEADFAVETWSYDPAGLSDRPVVDPLSLYAQFWDHADERVSAAAHDLLESLSW